MRIIKVFKTEEEKKKAIAETSLPLVEEANHIDGNYLIFSDEPKKLTWQEEIIQKLIQIENRLIDLEDKAKC